MTVQEFEESVQRVNYALEQEEKKRKRKLQFALRMREQEAEAEYRTVHAKGYCKHCFQLIPYGSGSCPNCD